MAIFVLQPPYFLLQPPGGSIRENTVQLNSTSLLLEFSKSDKWPEWNPDINGWEDGGSEAQEYRS